MKTPKISKVGDAFVATNPDTESVGIRPTPQESKANFELCEQSEALLSASPMKDIDQIRRDQICELVTENADLQATVARLTKERDQAQQDCNDNYTKAKELQTSLATVTAERDQYRSVMERVVSGLESAHPHDLPDLKGPQPLP